MVDLILPDGSGEDLARRILELHPALKLVISSGMAYEAPKDLASRVCVFQKPFLPRQLLNVLT